MADPASKMTQSSVGTLALLSKINKFIEISWVLVGIANSQKHCGGVGATRRQPGGRNNKHLTEEIYSIDEAGADALGSFYTLNIRMMERHGNSA